MDIVFTSLEDWDEVWRRNQFLCSHWVERHVADRILFVQPALDVSNAIRRGNLRVLFRGEKADPHSRIQLYRPLKLLPNTYTWGRRINAWLHRIGTRRAMRKAGFGNPLLWINDHAQEHLVGTLGESAVVYDVTDDWTELDPGSTAGRLVRQQDASLCAKADAIIVCSKRLLELKSAVHSHVRLIPNGVDVEHYRHVCDGTLTHPTIKTSWERPIFGYTGTIHPARVDVGMTKQVAERLEKGTLLFVGPNHLKPQEQEQLRATRRVVFAGTAAYHEIPAWMSLFDVCMVPHVVSPFTESLNPIKLWEYLAAGKPIVATPVAGFRDFAGLIRLASTAGEFASALMSAETEPSTIAQEGPRIASLHSWNQRVQQVEEFLKEVQAGIPHPSSCERFNAPRALPPTPAVKAYTATKL